MQATITITAHANLINLHRVIRLGSVTGATSSVTYPGLGQNFVRLFIQSDPANGGNLLWVGDGTLSTSARGVALLAGSSREYDSGAGQTNANLADRYLLTDTDGTIINVEWN